MHMYCFGIKELDSDSFENSNDFLFQNFLSFFLPSNEEVGWIKTGSSWIDPPQAKFRHSSEMLPVRAHRIRDTFQVRSTGVMPAYNPAAWESISGMIERTGRGKLSLWWKRGLAQGTTSVVIDWNKKTSTIIVYMCAFSIREVISFSRRRMIMYT